MAPHRRYDHGRMAILALGTLLEAHGSIRLDRTTLDNVDIPIYVYFDPGEDEFILTTEPFAKEDIKPGATQFRLGGNRAL